MPEYTYEAKIVIEADSEIEAGEVLDYVSRSEAGIVLFDAVLVPDSFDNRPETA